MPATRCKHRSLQPGKLRAAIPASSLLALPTARRCAEPDTKISWRMTQCQGGPNHFQIHFGLISRAGVLLLGSVSLPSPALTAVLTFPFAQRSEACAAHHSILLNTAASSHLPSQRCCLPAKGGQALQHFSRASTCPKNFHCIGVVRVTCLVR